MITKKKFKIAFYYVTMPLWWGLMYYHLSIRITTVITCAFILEKIIFWTDPIYLNTSNAKWYYFVIQINLYLDSLIAKTYKVDITMTETKKKKKSKKSKSHKSEESSIIDEVSHDAHSKKKRRKKKKKKKSNEDELSVPLIKRDTMEFDAIPPSLQENKCNDILVSYTSSNMMRFFRLPDCWIAELPKMFFILKCKAHNCTMRYLLQYCFLFFHQKLLHVLNEAISFIYRCLWLLHLRGSCIWSQSRCESRCKQNRPSWLHWLFLCSCYISSSKLHIFNNGYEIFDGIFVLCDQSIYFFCSRRWFDIDSVY